MALGKTSILASIVMGLMFRIAGEMLEELGADFIISGDGDGQRPMSPA